MDTEPSACGARCSEAEYLAQMRELAISKSDPFCKRDDTRSVDA